MGILYPQDLVWGGPSPPFTQTYGLVVLPPPFTQTHGLVVLSPPPFPRPPGRLEPRHASGVCPGCGGGLGVV